jgi:hypothetical protein
MGVRKYKPAVTGKERTGLRPIQRSSHCTEGKNSRRMKGSGSDALFGIERSAVS